MRYPLEHVVYTRALGFTGAWLTVALLSAATLAFPKTVEQRSRNLHPGRHLPQLAATRPVPRAAMP